MLGSVSSHAAPTPDQTAVNMPRAALAGRQVPLSWAILAVLGLGGGGSGVALLSTAQDGTKALVRVEAAEAAIKETGAEDKKQGERIKALEDGAAMEYLRARERARIQQWMVGTLVGNHAAISAIAKKLDVVVPPLEALLPQGPDWPAVVNSSP